VDERGWNRHDVDLLMTFMADLRGRQDRTQERVFQAPHGPSGDP
jgi:hypothetical protein